MTLTCHPNSSFRVVVGFRPLDRKWVVHQILNAYWGVHRDEKKILRSLMHSLNFGLYEVFQSVDAAPKQIGFARVVTYHSTFSYICDVIIDPAYRGKGLGKFLMSEILADKAINATVCVLRSRDPEFYTRFGFAKCDAMLRKPGGAA